MYDDVKVKEVLAHNLKALRKKHHLTQKELADMVQMHRVTITHMERGAISITLGTILKICSTLNEPISEIVKGLEDTYMQL